MVPNPFETCFCGVPSTISTCSEAGFGPKLTFSEGTWSPVFLTYLVCCFTQKHFLCMDLLVLSDTPMGCRPCVET